MNRNANGFLFRSVFEIHFECHFDWLKSALVVAVASFAAIWDIKHNKSSQKHGNTILGKNTKKKHPKRKEQEGKKRIEKKTHQ